MSLDRSLLLMVIPLVAFPICGKSEGLKAANRPNILFIMADDMGAWTLGSQGFPNSHTPHLDRLASQGVLLENAFSVSAVCRPSRAALVTGRYSSEAGAVDNNNAESEGNFLKAGIPTWPATLKQAGYRTILIGKWGLKGNGPEDYPTNRGYSEFAGFLEGGGRSKEPTIQFLKNGAFGESDLTSIDYEKVPGDQYTADLLADFAMDYIRKASGQAEPFCISLHFWAPHANTDFPTGYDRGHDDRSWLPLQDFDQAFWNGTEDGSLVLPEPDFPHLEQHRVYRMLREYHSSIHAVDRNIGRILACLSDPDGDGDHRDSLDGDTMVVVTSDHGYMMGHHGMWHKGRGRWLTKNQKDPFKPRLYGDTEIRMNLFDNSLRVPAVIRWPGQLPSGRSIHQTVTHLDWFPTLAAVAEIALPDPVVLSGRNVLPLLQGVSPADWNNDLFAQFQNLRTYRTREWKLVRHYQNRSGDELYNLVNDPSESKNLIHVQDVHVRGAVRELERKLEDYMRSINDPLL